MAQCNVHDLTTSREEGLGSRVLRLPPALCTRHHCAPPENGKMVAPSAPVTHASSYYGSEGEIDINSIASMSDYGSEFDATELDEDTLLASTLDSITQQIPISTKKRSVLPSIEFEEGEIEDEDQDDRVVVHKPSLLRVAKRDRRSASNANTRRDIQSSPVQEALEVEYDERSRRAWSGVLPTPSLYASSTD